MIYRTALNALENSNAEFFRLFTVDAYARDTILDASRYIEQFATHNCNAEQIDKSRAKASLETLSIASRVLNSEKLDYQVQRAKALISFHLNCDLTILECSHVLNIAEHSTRNLLCNEKVRTFKTRHDKRNVFVKNADLRELLERRATSERRATRKRRTNFEIAMTL